MNFVDHNLTVEDIPTDKSDLIKLGYKLNTILDLDTEHWVKPVGFNTSQNAIVEVKTGHVIRHATVNYAGDVFEYVWCPAHKCYHEQHGRRESNWPGNNRTRLIFGNNL